MTTDADTEKLAILVSDSDHEFFKDALKLGNEWDKIVLRSPSSEGHIDLVCCCVDKSISSAVSAMEDGKRVNRPVILVFSPDSKDIEQQLKKQLKEKSASTDHLGYVYESRGGRDQAVEYSVNGIGTTLLAAIDQAARTVLEHQAIVNHSIAKVQGLGLCASAARFRTATKEPDLAMDVLSEGLERATLGAGTKTGPFSGMAFHVINGDVQPFSRAIIEAGGKSVEDAHDADLSLDLEPTARRRPYGVPCVSVFTYTTSEDRKQKIKQVIENMPAILIPKSRLSRSSHDVISILIQAVNVLSAYPLAQTVARTPIARYVEQMEGDEALNKLIQPGKLLDAMYPKEQ